MATHPQDSALTTLTIPDSEKAWHLLALLLSLGRPARLSELASRCTSFPASTHLVQHLCSIANSPLSLSQDLYITPSLLAVAALAESVSCSGAVGALRTYLGKRKRVVLDSGFVPSAKRFIVDFENVNEANGARKAVICSPPKIHFRMADYLSRRINMLPSDVAVGVSKLMFNSTLFIEYSAGPSSCGVKNVDNVEDQLETNLVLQRNVNNTIMACVDDLEPTVPTVSDDLVLYEEADMHEIDNLAKSYLEKSKQSIMSPVLDENVSGSCKVTNATILEDEKIVGDWEEELLVDPGNPNGETKNISQPHTAFSDTLPGIDSRRLEEEDYEDTISLKKRLIRILETRAKRPATDLSVAEKQLLPPSAKVSNDLVLYEVAKMLEKVSNDLVLYDVANMLERTKQSIMSPALDMNVNSSHKVTNATILNDVRTVGDEEEELLVDSGNSNGESENLCSQPYAAVSDKLPGIDSRRLKEEEYEDTIPVKRHTIRHETQTICPETDFFSAKVSNDLVLYEGANMHEIDSQGKSYLEKTKQSIMPALDENFSGSCKGTNARNLEDRRIVGDAEEGLLVDPGNSNGETENLSQPYTAVSDELPGIDSRRLEKEDHEDTIPVNKSFMRRNETQTICPATEFYVPQKQLLKSSATMKAIHKDKISSRLQSLYGCGLEQDQAVAAPKVNLHRKMDQKTNSMIHKSKQNCGDMHINERKKRHKSISSKDQPEKKELPNFDSYMVEEEEGSGGYGTVYRARTKNDKTRVAIKCPHANAHKNHANNELRMLERFGGKNFVIKYEGCIKNGNSNCFVLQHVEHDRPEVLKKEIDVCELRWYGYCLFRALASLHKQGIVHRDVKPGNFLFSRKANKGYLIDFNLAMDLHQKYGNISKSRGGFDVNSNDEKLITAKTLPPITLRKLPSGKSLLTANGETSKGFKSTFDMKDLKKMAFSQMKAKNDSGCRKVIKSQGADGSGITSVKDVTSTRTPSAERLREPLPCQGRKELISLVQEARVSPNRGASSVSALMRKRVPAPPVNVDGKLFHVTPMPMHSTANGIGGPCLIRSRGVGKHKEGPCVGTKGFRAPEVLFRSPHQGPKIDVWSAGVTLLYLLIGRTPFFGEPEQNIKDIAKLRGSEDLWEVAKLHDCESSFPVDLYSTDCLPSIKLKDWCRRSTKRPDFFEKIPKPLFDLVDKCLMVNPRLRISAEEALTHEFFVPCHEELRKHRLQRQVLF